MTIREIFDKQRQTRGSDLYLIQQGIFYHAFNECADFIASCTGYQVRTLYTPYGETYQQLGFPTHNIANVIDKMHEQYPHIVFDIQGTLVHIYFE